MLLQPSISPCLLDTLNGSVAAVDAVRLAGKICILDIDLQGVRSVKKSDLRPNYVLIEPPSLEKLEERLRDG